MAVTSAAIAADSSAASSEDDWWCTGTGGDDDDSEDAWWSTGGAVDPDDCWRLSAATAALNICFGVKLLCLLVVDDRGDSGFASSSRLSELRKRSSIGAASLRKSSRRPGRRRYDGEKGLRRTACDAKCFCQLEYPATIQINSKTATA